MPQAGEAIFQEATHRDQKSLGEATHQKILGEATHQKIQREATHQKILGEATFQKILREATHQGHTPARVTLRGASEHKATHLRLKAST